MLTAKDLATKLQALQEEQAAKLASIKDNVETVNTVITSAVFTAPNQNGDVYCRITVADKLPAYTKGGDLTITNSILLFKNQILSAMSESVNLAIYAKLSYLQEEVDGLQRLSTLLCGHKITLKYVGLEAGENYIDPATGNKSEKTTSSDVIRYSIDSIE